MYDIEKEEEKLRMLEIMEENHWETETNKDSSHEDVEQDFNLMISEFEAIRQDWGNENEEDLNH